MRAAVLVTTNRRMQVARHPECEAVVTGIVGCAGLLPTGEEAGRGQGMRSMTQGAGSVKHVGL
jgi:1-deoxy-D-xylulose 5-phosphate reductoisomerase